MLVSFDDLPTYRDHVLVDGAFDPLHAGHLAYLAAARAHGPLLCAVASDDQIREKGKIPFLPQAQRVALLEALSLVSHVHAKDRPTEQVLEQMRPKAYIKGHDWRGNLTDTQIDICGIHQIPIIYTETPKDSSTERLRAWALADADHSLEDFERFACAQVPAPQPWQPVTDFSFEARRQVEGIHPLLIQEVFRPETVLDAGCGPGHLVRLLRELGITTYGCDLHPPEGPFFSRLDLCADVPEQLPAIFDLVISRECLEHLTFQQIRKAVTSLCRLSTRYVYGTTRFNPDPKHVLDVTTEFDVDPTHISCGTHWLLRLLFALEGFTWRGDLAKRMDWMHKGRTFCFERASV